MLTYAPRHQARELWGRGGFQRARVLSPPRAPTGKPIEFVGDGDENKLCAEEER